MSELAKDLGLLEALVFVSFLGFAKITTVARIATRGAGVLDVILDIDTSAIIAEKAHDRSLKKRLFG